MKITFHKRFIKHYALLPHKIQNKADQCIDTFMTDPCHPSLHNHVLAWVYHMYRSINVTGDYRIIFRELSDGSYELVELIDVGTHSQLYG